MVGFHFRVALLRGQPPRQRLAVIVVYHAVQVAHFAVQGEPVSVALVSVARAPHAVQYDPRRIYRSTQRPAVDPIDERSAKARGCLRLEFGEFAHEVIAQFIIRIERENPFRLNLRETKIALLCKAVEWSIEAIDLRVTLEYLDRPVDTSAVNDHDTARPRQLVEGARDIRRFIERNDQRRDRINHSDVLGESGNRFMIEHRREIFDL